jgi:hypothetical protein
MATSVYILSSFDIASMAACLEPYWPIMLNLSVTYIRATRFRRSARKKERRPEADALRSYPKDASSAFASESHQSLAVAVVRRYRALVPASSTLWHWCSQIAENAATTGEPQPAFFSDPSPECH